MASASTKVFLTLCVFSIGTGIGLGLRQGWLPIEFLPPPAGAIRESTESDLPDADIAEGTATEMVDQSEPPLFESQGEPPVLGADISETRPRRLQIPEGDFIAETSDKEHPTPPRSVTENPPPAAI